MATYKTTGIVIRRHNLGEADRILTIMTDTHGKVRAVAKGIRRIKSRMAGHLELFNDCQLMLAEGRNLDIVTSARLIHSSDELTTDYARLRQAYMAAELVDVLVDENESQPVIFALLADYLAGLSASPEPGLWELGFRLRLADQLGYRPELGSCVVCGQSGPTSQYYFEISRGGLVCERDHSSLALDMSQPQIKLWRLLLAAPKLTATTTSQDTAELSRDGLNLIKAFYDYTFGRTFRTESLLASS